MTSIDQTALISTTQTLLHYSQDDNFFDDHHNYTLLVDTLIDHNHLYHVENNPIISDYDYDLLFTRLKAFESLHPAYIRDDSPTQKLIGQYETQKEFAKSDHLTPILSLQNTYDSKDIMDRYDSITTMLHKKIEEIEDAEIQNNLRLKIQNLSTDKASLQFLIEPKYDGLSIILTYTDGRLTKAVTRGDGYTGDDVTENIKTIKNLPQSISHLGGEMSQSDRRVSQNQESLASGKRGVGGDLDLIKKITTLRGEVLMPKSTRTKLNTEKESNGEQPFANTRNAAAGSLKLLDTNEVAKRGLVCYVYDVLSPPSEGGGGKPEGYYSQTILDQFTHHTTPNNRQDISINQVIDIINNPDTKDSLLQADIDFDGLVIKIVDPEIRALLGSTNHHPRRAIAYKFPAQQVATQIISIDRQIGRTGILTPVANLTPTKLSGVTISRVSLHNWDFITTKNIRIGDRVRLQRSGEVIPYIVGVITQRRDDSEKEINPDNVRCPACGSAIQITTNIVGTKINPQTSTQFFCTNKECPGILKEQLKHFVSKNCMNISSIGEATLDMLVDQQMITSISDIYTLTQPETIFLLKRFPGIGSKKVDTFVAEILASKSNPLRRLLNSLGINGVGIKLAKEIEKQVTQTLSSGSKKEQSLKTLFRLITQSDFLEQIYGIGAKIIIELQSRYQDSNNQLLLQQLSDYDIQPTLGSQYKDLGIRIKGIICITGTFTLSRSELEFHITQAGYTFSPTLTKNTDYLFVGANAGSKTKKVSPSTKIIDNVEEIYTMLGISTPLFTPLDKGGTEEVSPSSGTVEMQSLFG